ncbi:NAD(P)/FAD-dependent oxidoreductase [Nonomuraea gerenzanensis]|uniref:D-amino acid dehydrogenase small subunit n=1 Tax=Nonomuraea gerenzanensis TaxID=93944 RepID=A0A1M4EJP8_9ACTN|nr:FAD-dependent oxidoreductase [Nonomuraea gerenzanensis]UBU10532.1 FAD-binding oxidoreductase [Nonomuraea gerenzanensis]SBO98938.1 D-amino acid dehydrogenase small subunit [Nonomuraea gerenzanensis]
MHVIVIGSGIAGASAAFALSRRGAAVTVVDSGEAGQATAASAGIIAPWASAVEGPFYDLYAAGAAYYPEVIGLLAEAGVERTDYRRNGELLVHEDPALLDEAQARVEARARDAGAVVGEVRRIGNDEVRALFPVLADTLEGVFISGGGRVDGRTMRDALLQGAARYGARQVRGRARLRPQGPPLVEVGADLLAADAVLVASGAWADELLEPRGLRLAVEPQRGQISHLRLDGVDTSGWPSVHPLSHHYLVAFDDSRVAVGATRETGSGFDARVTARGQLQVLSDALRIAPGLADATLIETRVGLRPLAQEQVPIAGPLPGTDGLHVVTGFGAAGLTMAPYTGDALARSILGGEPVPELAPFAP